MLCAFHVDRIAIEKCRKCGRDICQACVTFIKGQVFCSRCAPAMEFLNAEGNKVRDPIAAAILSFICPGMGQVYNGEAIKGVFVFLSCILFFPWIYGIVDAFRVSLKINRGERRMVGVKISAPICAILGVAIMSSPFVIWNARRHYLRMANVDTEKPAVERRLKKISAAMELFARDKGFYPKNSREMYFSQPAYFDELFCDTSFEGYSYRCELSRSGYRIDAVPDGDRDKVKFSIMTNGVLQTE